MGIFGVVLGILAIICAIAATFLFGTVGGVVAGILGAVAIVLGFLKQKKDGKGGIGSIVTGVLAIVLAFSLAGTWTTMYTDLHKKAVEYKPDGLWAQVSEDVNGGIMGIISRLPQDDASVNALIEEMSELTKMTEAKD